MKTYFLKSLLAAGIILQIAASTASAADKDQSDPGRAARDAYMDGYSAVSLSLVSAGSAGFVDNLPELLASPTISVGDKVWYATEASPWVVLATATAFGAGYSAGKVINRIDEKHFNSALRNHLSDAIGKVAKVSQNIKKQIDDTAVSLMASPETPQIRAAR